METVMIQGEPIEVKEYQGQRVVTFKEINRVHGRSEKTAEKRFSEHRDKFIEGIDFFHLTRREILKSGFRNLESNRGITLITESGYLMLVKSFQDDLAWEVQRNLVNGYFRMRLDVNLEDNTVEATDPAAVLDADQLIKCAEVMSQCLDGNRSYVLNILRKVVPEIDQGDQPDKKTNDSIPFKYQQFKNFMSLNGVSAREISEKTGISEKRIYEYRSGKVVPKMYTRKRLTMALGLPDDYFNNEKRVRRINTCQKKKETL